MVLEIRDKIEVFLNFPYQAALSVLQQRRKEMPKDKSDIKISKSPYPDCRRKPNSSSYISYYAVFKRSSSCIVRANPYYACIFNPESWRISSVGDTNSIVIILIFRSRRPSSTSLKDDVVLKFQYYGRHHVLLHNC